MSDESPNRDELNEKELWEGPIPAHLARRRTGFRPQFLVAGLLLVGVIISLMVYGLTTAKAYWLTVDEVYQRESSLLSQRIRVNGVVVEGSEEWNPSEVTLRFKIQDEENPNRQLEIVYKEPRPDNFHRAASVIAEGELLPGGLMEAEVLLVTCPSRYEEAPEDIVLQANP